MQPTASRSLTARIMAIVAVVAILAVAIPIRPATRTAAQAAPGCVGWTSGGVTYTTRRMQYTSDGVLHLVGCGEVFTLTDIRTAMGPPSTIVGAEPTDALQLVDAANKIWMLNVKINVEEGATLNLIGGAGGDVNWLRLKSGAAGIVWVKAQNSTLLIQNTRISSWDPTTGTFDHTNPGAPGIDEEPGGGTEPRSFIVARSVLAPGRAWTAPTACNVNGGTRDAYEARMDVINSQIDHLGYHGAEAYGVSWKVYSTDASLLPPNSRELYNRADVFGTISNSTFSENYFGNYMFGGYCMSVTGSSYADNYWYGLDPHDDTDYMTVSGNTFTGNDGHGFICSVYCDNLVVSGNQALNNGKNGLMIHRRVDGAIVENNISSGNGDSGLAIFDSYGAVVRNNTFQNNGIAAIRFSVSSSNNLIESNTLTGIPTSASGNGHVLYSFMGSDLPTEGGNRRISGNTFRGNAITGFKSPVVKFSDATGNVFEDNTITASSSLTTYELRDGQGNVIQRNIVSGKTTVNTVRSSSSQPVASTTLRNPAIGREIAIRHSPSNGATTTVEDSRSNVWSGADVTAATDATRGTITGSSKTIKPLDFTVIPAANTVTVSVSSWATSAPFAKSWTERASTNPGAVAHTVGNLLAGQCYAVTVDGGQIGTFQAGGSGSNARISFDYTGGFSGSSARSFSVAATQGSPCGVIPTATATATSTGTPTQTPTSTATPTETAVPTETATPTETPTATATATATATVPASPIAFTDDFESGDLAAWTSVNGLVVQTDEAFSGSHAARGTTTGNVVNAQRTLSSPQTDLYYRVRFKVVTKSSLGYLLRFRTATNSDIVGLNISSSGKLSVYNRSTNTTTASTTVVSNGVWHEVELHVNQATGLIEVWYDGQPVDALTFQPGVGTAPIGRVELGDAASGRVFDIVFDDVELSTSFIQLTFSPEPTATATPTRTATPTKTATPISTATPTPTERPTEVPTATPTPTETPTEVPTEMPTEVPTATPVPTDTPIPTEVPTEPPADTPTPVE